MSLWFEAGKYAAMWGCMTTQATSTWPGPLKGVRVLDFSRVLAGPSAAMALADLGAEVIKIEPPGTGDETRSFPPMRNQESHYFLSLNRGKKSIVIDLKSERGVALVKAMAANCDVLIENYRPGVMARLGLDYAILSALNPRLIYCSISGFGMTGPLKDQPSFDIVTQALSGAMSVNGEPGSPPLKMGLPLGDLVGGINGPMGILAALFERSVTGRGRLIDVSLLDGLIGMLTYLPQLAYFTGENPKPQGSQHANLVPYGVFPAQNGSIVIACLTNGFWANICKALAMDDWIKDPRFDSLQKRRERRAEVNERISAQTCQKTIDDLVVLFTQHQVPHAPILGIRDALSQPQARAREMVVEVDHQSLGRIPIVNRPIKFPGSPQPAPSAPPVLGQHSEEILRDLLGLDADAIEALRRDNIVA